LTVLGKKRRTGGGARFWVAAAAVLALAPSLIESAAAQLFDHRYQLFRSRPPQQQQQQQQQQQRGFFPFFFPGPAPAPELRPPVDFSRAPPARKPEAPPIDSIVVAGDSMADWLAYGLEDTLADTPELGVVRKVRTHSGLIRYEPRSDTTDWAQALREFLANESPKAIIMMIGLQDRQVIRERAAHTPPGSENQDQQNSNQSSRNQQSIAAPEPRRVAAAGNFEFRSEQWVEYYIKRIDDTIAALKSKGVPVLWVGLPAIRGARSSSDMSFLNDLYRTRAEKAGIVYVDVWDGFVDEAGRFANSGPDPEGQIRRLRTGDGVHFTKAGARKLAHFVERDLRRVLSNRAVPVALPTQDEPALSPARPGVPAPRPVAGPVVPLTSAFGGTRELLGGTGVRPAGADPTATRVLTRGEAIAAPSGRADDFAWPRPAGPNEGIAAGSPAATPVSIAPERSPSAARSPTASEIPPAAARTTPKPQAAPAAPSAQPAAAARPATAAQSRANTPVDGANTRPPPRRPPPRTDFFDSPPRPPLPIGPLFR
jgi:hypothetical protein